MGRLSSASKARRQYRRIENYEYKNQKKDKAALENSGKDFWYERNATFVGF